uniref:Small RNA 2'-O-methyltransferase n=2 Tax=Ixodes ricinus TaxID=34613 RepID=A0A131XWR4_IXORI
MQLCETPLGTEPPLDVNKNTLLGEEVEECSRIRFDPPVGIQRYIAVSQILSEDDSVQRVVDFGCSTGQFFRYLKKIEHLRHFAAVDISYGCLEGACHVARPLVWDCIHKRAHSLTARFYRGSVADQDPRLRGFDGVTCIELVEHLHQDDLKKLPGTIFGFVRPKVAVITTPNRDFNVVFPELRGMRHWDHKFEWSRAEFQSWCSGILDAHPGYSVEYTGVGDAPSGEFPGIGHCSQIAIFRKISNDKDLETSSPELPVYELISETVHPGRED